VTSKLRVLGKIIDNISDYMGYFSVGILVFMTVAVLFEMTMRGAFNMPTRWAGEYTTYALIAFSFLSAAYVAKRGGHVNVDIIISRLSERTKLGVELVNHALGAIFFVIFSYNAIVMTQTSIRLQARAITILETPLWTTYIPVVVGAILLTLQLARIAISKGVLLSHTKGDSEKQSSIFAPIDKLYVFLPIYFALIAGMCILLAQGGQVATIGLVISLLVMLAGGMPIFLAMGISAGIGLYFLMGGGLLESQALAPAVSYNSLMNFVLIAAPLFILGAGLLQISGLADQLFDVTRLWLSRLPGSLAIATIAACAIFAAITGESVACAAAIGMIAVPGMLKRDYDEKLASGCTAAGGTLGILIPPSISFILYGYITETSVGQLFIAGFIPGIMLAGLYSTFIFLRCLRDPRYKPLKDVTWKQRFASLKDAAWILLAPVFIMGSIYTGLFTPTESAAGVVAYAIVVGFLSKKLSWRHIKTSLLDTTKSGGFIMMVTPMAVTFGAVVIQLRLPQMFTEFVIGLNVPPLVVMGFVFLLLLVLGTFMSAIAMTLITVPILFPAVMALGYDPIWFGVFFVINVEMALVTPPVGMNLYVIQAVSGVKLEKIILGVLPFILIQVLALALITFFQPLATWLPSTMQ